VDELDDQVVAVCIARLDSSGVWWARSKNFKGIAVKSCRDAVKHRNRVGSGRNGGIPLWAELKSLLGWLLDSEGHVLTTFAAHTRANTQFNHDRLIEALGYEPRAARIHALVDEAMPGGTAVHYSDGLELPAHLGEARWFGRVNPFNVDLIVADITGEFVDADDVVQVIDCSVEADGGVPDTLMTNLGERTSSLEIGAFDLERALASFSTTPRIADIADVDPIWLGLRGDPVKDYWLQCPPPYGPKIGILTGNGPDSGRTLWSDVDDALHSIYHHLPDLWAPPVVVNSVPAMGLSMDLVARKDDVRAAVIAGVTSLLEAECKLVTVACNTSIYFAREIEELCLRYSAEFVSIADACMPAVRAAVTEHGQTQVALVGTGSVVDMEGGHSGYRVPLESKGLTVVPCPAEDLAFAVKSGRFTKAFVTEFRRIMRQLSPDVKVVILALTEVSMVYRAHTNMLLPEWEVPRVFIDPLHELGRYLAYRYLLRGYMESPVCQIREEKQVVARLRGRFGWADSDGQPTEPSRGCGSSEH
jgi:aspartate/glutamate racemase